MQDSNEYEVAVSALERRLDDLAVRADRIVDGHWRAVQAMERRFPGWENKSQLQVRSAKEGNSLRLDWFGVKWYGSKAKGTRKPMRTHIGKPAGAYSFSLSKLYTHCKEWEKPMVRDTEEQLATIRREARHIAKALQLIRFARQAGSVATTGMEP